MAARKVLTKSFRVRAIVRQASAMLRGKVPTLTAPRAEAAVYTAAAKFLATDAAHRRRLMHVGFLGGFTDPTAVSSMILDAATEAALDAEDEDVKALSGAVATTSVSYGDTADDMVESTVDRGGEWTTTMAQVARRTTRRRTRR